MGAVSSFSDNFNRSDSSTVGNGWSEVAGDFEIASNMLNYDNSDGGLLIQTTDTPSEADYYLECDFKIVFHVSLYGNWPGLLIRYADTSHFYLCQFGQGADSLKRMQVYKNNAGWTQLSSVAVTINDDTWYTIKFLINGDNLIGYVDDVEKTNVTDSALTAAGYFGIRDGTIVGNTYFDNFVFSTLGGGEVVKDPIGLGIIPAPR